MHNLFSLQSLFLVLLTSYCFLSDVVRYLVTVLIHSSNKYATSYTLYSLAARDWSLGHETAFPWRENNQSQLLSTIIISRG